MILKESILSAFTDKATLLEWLKKVEAALNGAVLTDISIEQPADDQLSLKFTFEDGSFVESPKFYLPRGPQGEPGADGKDGTGIAATVTAGKTVTLIPGSGANVVNVGTDVNAVLDFYIPEGAEGVGFNCATDINGITNISLVEATETGVTIHGKINISTSEGTFQTEGSLVLPLVGSESIVVDATEDNLGLELHLDGDVQSILNRALVCPLTAPSAVVIPAINTANAQVNLGIGDGLSVNDEGQLVATGGGGGSTHYTHRLRIYNITDEQAEAPVHLDVTLVIKSTDNTNIASFVALRNAVSMGQIICVSGALRGYFTSSVPFMCISGAGLTTTQLSLKGIFDSDETTYKNLHEFNISGSNLDAKYIYLDTVVNI